MLVLVFINISTWLTYIDIKIHAHTTARLLSYNLDKLKMMLVINTFVFLELHDCILVLFGIFLGLDNSDPSVRIYH